ncbi:glycosyltransferase [Streptomyces sp. H10-C2]|uniref:glycosyltransferase n=1 Tax=unclassified Streptomyces TaxID=2593676 RepID=UPI0024B88232|nr:MULTISPECIES: glycosyltransferase [unclassified Streptomyces]MDJ0341178.1 glycosyltransferase [Streptomyces sp. PH10-H1]MDJ0369469.1 glycosyltransferase [Streptomyces sp. H10-C2]
MLLVSWNTLTETRRCLASLPSAATDGLRYETIVVDNGSRDGSAQMLAERPDLLLIANDSNRGFAAAVNQAYAHATGQLILLLNSDVSLHPGALTKLVRFLQDRPEAAGVAPLYLNPDGTVQQHYMQLPTFRSALALATALRFLPGFRRAWRTYLMSGQDWSSCPVPVAQPSASSLLLRRSVLGPAEILDERFPIYFNDVLLARTLADAGHQLWMTPDAVVTHTLGASTGLLGHAARSRHHLGGLIRYLRVTQPRHRLGVFRALVLGDRLARRTLRRPGGLGLGDLFAALRGDVGPLPDGGDSRSWAVMLSGVAWSSGEHRQHALARELAAGRRVLFVDPPGPYPRWRLTVRPVEPSLWHAVPPSVLPFGQLLPPVNWLNRKVAAALLRRWLGRRPGARLLWIDEDLAAPAAGRLGEDTVVYDATDLDWTFTRPWNRWHLRSGLRSAVAGADLVLASSTALPERLPVSRRPPIVVPNGCDPSHFCADGPTVERVGRLTGPLLGYAGAIDTRAFDGELIAAVARRRPDWTLVLAGPSTRSGRAPLAGLPNVHLLGPVPFDDVPAVLRACDVCLIPYRLGGLIDYVHPKKFYEYLAMGKPVVATPLPALSGLGALSGLVHLAGDAAGFTAAIEAALDSCRNPDAGARRRAVAVRNSWSTRGEQLRALLAGLEAERR